MKYYIVAGEASGDLHGSNMMKALKRLDNQAEFRVWGGDLMEKESNSPLVKHYRDTDFMGFTEVIANLRTILRNIKDCKIDILKYQPDVLVLIDYPGFNLRIAKWAKAKGFLVAYYISPQVWAWKASRVKTIRKVVDKMFVILPFEKDFYATYDYPVEFVGHPLLDAIDNLAEQPHFRAKHQLNDKKIIALLPGSRGQEIKNLLPTMLELVSLFPDYQFVLAGAPAIPPEIYKIYLNVFNKILKQKKQTPITLHIVYGETYALLQNAHAAIVASGTATLETALFKVPQIVCYKGSAISFAIAKRIVNIKYISLVNLIMDKLVVTELVQDDFNLKNLEKTLIHLLNPAQHQKMLNDYESLCEKLGGGASYRVAAGILALAKAKK